MKKRDPALSFEYSGLIGAIYFGLLSVVGTVLTNAFLSLLGIEQMVPLFVAVLLGMAVSSIMGALFGKYIIQCKYPYYAKTFLIGFAMVMISLPIFDLGIVLFMKESYKSLFASSQFHDLVPFYFIVLGYSYVLFGFALGIGSGLAAMFLRGRLVYDALHTYPHEYYTPAEPDEEKNK
jgi:hypothetical protein